MSRDDSFVTLNLLKTDCSISSKSGVTKTAFFAGVLRRGFESWDAYGIKEVVGLLLSVFDHV